MKKAEIKIGGLYQARVSGNFVTVRVDAIREEFSGLWANRKSRDIFDVTNLDTGRKLVFRSAAKFRGMAKAVELNDQHKFDRYGYGDR